MATRSSLARVVVAVVAPVFSSAAGLLLQNSVGYRFPLIAFYPAVMVSAWFGGFWSGLLSTALSILVVDRVWLAPLRAAGQGAPGDTLALLLFLGIGAAISGFSESLHRSTASEHAARQRAEDRQHALMESERRLQEALANERAAREDAEAANRLKDQFLATVSHELRTPLNALLGWADMLKKHTLPDERRERAIEAIHANATRQAQLVDDLLDVARMMSGKLQLQLRPVDVGDTLRAALEIVQRSADARHIDITLDAPASGAVLHADAIRLQQILWNLLSNAIKFTPDHGVVRVSIRTLPDDIVITVADSGQGIPAHLLRSIFNAFEQVDSSTTRTQGGLGLGLSIVKHLVEAHGGTVRAESPGEGRGATFIVRLPILPAGSSPSYESAVPGLVTATLDPTAKA